MHNKETKKWLKQRILAVVLLPFILWLLYFLHIFIGVYKTQDYDKIIQLMQNPINALIWLILSFTAFYHGILGMQVIIEDYVPNKIMRFIFILLVKFITLTTAIALLVATIKLITI
ncbi:MAG: succinate dehydrogenase, hydrophobic membrane anchor protein [Rickettsiaceae bacterium]|nr:succinate dehydrogenase, hydrophobic membrane anchor protein [Rickettsiaceae bacterium]